MVTEATYISDKDSICQECCAEVQDNSIDDLIDNINYYSIKPTPITIYIAGLLEKLTKELIIEKYYNPEIGQYCLNINPPRWFYSIETKYQTILIRVIEPVLESYLKEKN